MSSYLFPYDTLYNLWMTGVPIYELEPVDPAIDAAAAAAAKDSGDPAAQAAGTTPSAALRLVFKGTKWYLVPVSSMRENAFYNQLREGERDDDERRARERKHHPMLQPKPDQPETDLPTAPGAGGDQ